MNNKQSNVMSIEKINQDEQVVTWWATEFMKRLGYTNMDLFCERLQLARQTCDLLNLNTDDQFVEETRLVDGQSFTDYKLTRLACYLILVNTSEGKTVTVNRILAYLVNL